MTHLKAASEKAAEMRIRVARERAEHYRWFLAPLVDQGLNLTEITNTINSYRLQTPTAVGKWSPSMVKRALERLGIYKSSRAP